MEEMTECDLCTKIAHKYSTFAADLKKHALVAAETEAFFERHALTY